MGSLAPLDAQLGALALTHGRTETLIPLATSPLLDSGDPTSPLTEDQTRQSRPVNAIIDIGSIERRP